MSGYHAIETARGWSVRKSEARRAICAGLLEHVAWDLAQRLAKKHDVTAYKHDITGRITDRTN